MILQYLHYHGGDSPLEPEVFQDFPNVSHFVPRENHRNPPETTGSMGTSDALGVRELSMGCDLGR